MRRSTFQSLAAPRFASKLFTAVTAYFLFIAKSLFIGNASQRYAIFSQMYANKCYTRNCNSYFAPEQFL